MRRPSALTVAVVILAINAMFCSTAGATEVQMRLSQVTPAQMTAPSGAPKAAQSPGMPRNLAEARKMLDVQVWRGLSKVTPKLAANGRRLVAAWFAASELMEGGNCNRDDGGAVRAAYVNFALQLAQMDDAGKTFLQTATMLAASGSELANEYAVKTKIVFATSLALRRMMGTMALSNGCLIMAEEQYVKAATSYLSDVPGYDPAADMRRVSEARLRASSAK